MTKQKSIAVTIQNYVQFYSIKDALDVLIKNGVEVDFYVPHAKDDWGLKEMFDDIYNYLNKNGYNVRRNPLKKKYKILLEPYPMEYYFSFNYEYRIKYKYTIISAKPKLTYKISENFLYDAILCHSTYEYETLRNYTKTYIVGKPMYFDFKKKKNNDKPVLLYLPTYGEFGSIIDSPEGIKKLKKKYKVITKLHHGTNYFNYEEEKRKILKELFDECYCSDVSLKKLLETSDVVLTDNSGSIFDALYNNVPVAIFSDSLKDSSFGDIKSYQYQLVEKGILPCTNDPNKIYNVVEKALNIFFEKQIEHSKKIFPYKGKNGLNLFVKIINNYLEDKIDMDSLNIHREIYGSYKKLMDSNNSLKNDKLILQEREIELNDLQKKVFEKDIELNNLQKDNYELSKKLNDYEKGKLYKVSKIIYTILGKLIWKKK